MIAQCSPDPFAKALFLINTVAAKRTLLNQGIIDAQSDAPPRPKLAVPS